MSEEENRSASDLIPMCMEHADEIGRPPRGGETGLETVLRDLDHRVVPSGATRPTTHGAAAATHVSSAHDARHARPDGVPTMSELSPLRLMMRRVLGRRRWTKVEAILIDKRHLRTREFRGERTRATISYDEYLVEITGPDGEPVRLRIQEDHIEIPDVLRRHIPKGKVAKFGVHVHPDGEKAVFAKDFRESKEDQKRREKERRARDEERFRRQEGGS